MARQINRLSARTVSTLRTVGRHSDGNGLYLRISDDGGKRWVFRYRWGDKIQDKGLGSATTVSLKEARDAAELARKQLQAGINPVANKRAEASRAQGKFFAECASNYIAFNESGWKNEKHRDQWKSTLATYADPVIGKVAIDQITVDHLIKILEPIWKTKTETASRVRGRIEAVLDWAAARGFRSSENPARWRGHLDKVFPAIRKVSKVVHHPALPFAEMPTFMAELRRREGTSAIALEFAILTAARTGEVIGATRSEFDLDNKLWTIPAERMKAGVEFRQPMSDRAVAIIKSLAEKTAYVFPGLDIKKPLSNMSLLAVLSRMGRSDLTTHGFRSTFRDWAAETTEFPNELVEMALAHTIRNKAEAAYRRGDLLERRRVLMDAWSSYCQFGADTLRKPGG